MSIQGDDLDDGLEYSYSGSEDEGVELNSELEKQQLSSNDSDGDENKEGEESGSENNPQKRKRSDKDDKFKDKKKQKMEYDTNARILLSTLTPDIIAEKLATKIRSQNPDLSPLELSELYLSKNVIEYTGEWKSERNLIKLGKFIEYNFGSILPENPESKQSKKKSKKKSIKGKKSNTDDTATNGERKFILILSMSAIRACDVHRATKTLNGGSLKLINKNKLKDDLRILPTTRARVLAGTAGRVKKILEPEEGEPVVKFSEIDTIICDSTYLDSKKQHIWDVKEIIPLIKSIVDNNDKARMYLY